MSIDAIDAGLVSRAGTRKRSDTTLCVRLGFVVGAIAGGVLQKNCAYWYTAKIRTTPLSPRSANSSCRSNLSGVSMEYGTLLRCHHLGRLVTIIAVFENDSEGAAIGKV